MKKSFILSLVISLVSLIIAIYFAITIKEQIPTHWDMSGKITDYGSPLTLLMFPGISLFTTILMYVTPRLDPKGKNIKDSSLFMGFLMIFLSLLMLIIEIYTILLVSEIELFNINILINLMLGILFIVMGLNIHKIKPNYMLGIKTPWTLYSESVWKKTHQKSGIWFTINGITFLICILFPKPYNIVIPMIFMVLIMIGITIYSYLLYKEESKK